MDREIALAAEAFADCVGATGSLTEASHGQAYRILNRRLDSSVPAAPTAAPEVRVFDLHGERVALDANSLCTVALEDALADRVAAADPIAEDAPLRGLLFSRQKPQFGLSRQGGVRRVVLNVTHACNLACGYCFAGGHRDDRIMSLATATAAIKLIAPQHPIDLGFFGGEPLLAWDRVREIMETAHPLAGARKVACKFHITTNGMRLDRAKADFLSEQPCSVLVSLDGPEDLHNAARPARAGEGDSFAGAMAALEHAATPLGQRLMTRATFSADAPHLVRRLRFFAGLMDRGLIRGFSIEPAVLAESCAGRAGALDRDRMAAEYHAAAQWFVARLRTGKPGGFFHFQKLLHRIVTTRHTASECGAGVGYVTVAPDGTLYACHREADTAIGHVRSGFDEEARAPWCDNRLYARPHCMECWARYLCGGGCRQACLELTGRLDGVASDRCFLMRTMIRECLWILTQLTTQQIAKGIAP